MLVDWGLRPPTSQTAVARPDGRHVYCIDFAYMRQRIAIEVDGPHHFEIGQAISDRARDEYLKQRGWRVLRFSFLELDMKDPRNLGGFLAITEILSAARWVAGLDPLTAGRELWSTAAQAWTEPRKLPYDLVDSPSSFFDMVRKVWSSTAATYAMAPPELAEELRIVAPAFMLSPEPGPQPSSRTPRPSAAD